MKKIDWLIVVQSHGDAVARARRDELDETEEVLPSQKRLVRRIRAAIKAAYYEGYGVGVQDGLDGVHGEPNLPEMKDEPNAPNT